MPLQFRVLLALSVIVETYDIGKKYDNMQNNLVIQKCSIIAQITCKHIMATTLSMLYGIDNSTYLKIIG